MTYGRLFVRGLIIVTLTSWNVRHIAALEYSWAFAGGFGISFVWFTNSRTAAHSELKWAREVYALGAAVGTICGMYLGR